MEIVSVTPQNLEQEHICCALANNNDIQVSTKKAWLKQRFAEGLVFKKADIRGKCFIEYIPAENAWVPIDAPNCMHINCFWVSGKYKGQGLSSRLLDECIADSKKLGKSGITILSSPDKKQPFLIEPGFLKHKGFVEADYVDPHFSLYYLPLTEGTALPHFKAHLKSSGNVGEGFVLYYTDQCPFTAKYVALVADIAAERGVPFETRHIESAKDAQAAPVPFTTYALFYDGEFVGQEILSQKKFEALIAEKGY